MKKDVDFVSVEEKSVFEEINGDRERRIPTTSNLGFGGVSGERMLGELTD